MLLRLFSLSMPVLLYPTPKTNMNMTPKRLKGNCKNDKFILNGEKQAKPNMTEIGQLLQFEN